MRWGSRRRQPRVVLRVQVNLKSSVKSASLCVHGVRAFHPSGFTPERRRLVRAQVLRRARPDRLAARSRRTPAISPRGAASHCVYRFCVADRIVARGDRRGTCETSRRPDADAHGLVAHVRCLDEADRPKDRRASALESGPHPMHRMRVSLDRQMPIRQPG